MKVAMLYITRSKISLEQYNSLSDIGHSTTCKFLKGTLSRKVTSCQNYLVNCGMTWSDIIEVFDEIKSKKFDVVVFWFSPETSQLKMFYPRFCELMFNEFKGESGLKVKHVNDMFVNWTNGLIRQPIFGFKTSTEMKF